MDTPEHEIHYKAQTKSVIRHGWVEILGAGENGVPYFLIATPGTVLLKISGPKGLCVPFSLPIPAGQEWYEKAGGGAQLSYSAAIDFDGNPTKLLVADS